MTITATTVREYLSDHAIIGRNLFRVVEASGFYNTAGEPEVYRVLYNGTYNDGSIRADVQVQRKDGSFAMLNSNKHYLTIGRVLNALRDAEQDYRSANAAI